LPQPGQRCLEPRQRSVDRCLAGGDVAASFAEASELRTRGRASAELVGG
jgi:hypothetical protein